MNFSPAQKSFLALIIFFVVFFSHAAEITISAGVIMKNAHGDVISSGKAFAFNNDVKKYTTAIMKSGVPRDAKSLVRVLEDGEFVPFNAPYGDVDIINDGINRYKLIYKEIKDDSIQNNVINAERTIKASRAYKKDMATVERYKTIQNNFKKELGALDNELSKLTSEYNELFEQQLLMDNEFTKRANEILASKPNKPFLLSDDARRIINLKFMPSHFNKKSGTCHITKRTYIIDRSKDLNKCFRFSVAQAWQEYLNELGDLASTYFASFYEIETRLKGENNRDKSSLKYRISQIEKELKNKYRVFIRANQLAMPLRQLKKDFTYVNSLKNKWLKDIEKAKNAPFNPLESSRFNEAVLEPFLVNLREYYTSVAEQIIDEAVIDSKEFKDYKFEIDNASFYAIFTDLKAPLQKAKFGIFVKSNNAEQILAEQFSSNTLSFGYKPTIPDKDYIVATMLHLMKNDEYRHYDVYNMSKEKPKQIRVAKRKEANKQRDFANLKDNKSADELTTQERLELIAKDVSKSIEERKKLYLEAIYKEQPQLMELAKTNPAIEKSFIDSFNTLLPDK